MIERAACVCRAAVLDLGDGAEPGACDLADGLGLGEEQPDRRRDVQLESLTSEQHRTWSRAAGHGQHARKRAMGWMRCKRTPCRSFSSLGPAVVLSQRLLMGFPHTAGAFWVFGSGAGGDGDGIGSGEGGGEGGGGGRLQRATTFQYRRQNISPVAPDLLARSLFG
eukprot:scaffold96187_cov56-Phaeocystis_antarctica.AAC.6